MAEVNAAEDFQDWPDTMRRLALVIGPEETLLLADRCGGLDRIYIPYEVTTSHYWCAVLTPASWAKVVSAFGGERLDLPRGSFLRVRKREILELAQQGMPHRQIALRVQTTERYVRLVLQGLAIAKAEDDRQGKLF